MQSRSMTGANVKIILHHCFAMEPCPVCLRAKTPHRVANMICRGVKGKIHPKDVRVQVIFVSVSIIRVINSCCEAEWRTACWVPAEHSLTSVTTCVMSSGRRRLPGKKKNVIRQWRSNHLHFASPLEQLQEISGLLLVNIYTLSKIAGRTRKLMKHISWFLRNET